MKVWKAKNNEDNEKNNKMIIKKNSIKDNRSKWRYLNEKMY